VETESWLVNPIDLAVVLLLVLSAVFAFVRGFVREVLAIASWIGAYLAARFLYEPVSPTVEGILRTEGIAGALDSVGIGDDTIPLTADVLAGIALFFLSLILFSILTHYIAKGVRGAALSAVDRSLGFVFGLARGALVICLVFLGFVWLSPEPARWPEMLQEARTRPLIERGTAMIQTLVPPQFLGERYAEVERAIGLGETPPPLPGTPQPRRQGSGGDLDSDRLQRLLERSNDRN
jgi:membrane protein required for colicin V production